MWPCRRDAWQKAPRVGAQRLHTSGIDNFAFLAAPGPGQGHTGSAKAGFAHIRCVVATRPGGSMCNGTLGSTAHQGTASIRRRDCSEPIDARTTNSTDRL
jgi:hypothetical protein